ncbi:MAG: transglutaminase-like domain-containing protein [Sarcina sp.]
MEKKKITPLLIITILTAGIATSAHSIKLPEATQSHISTNNLTRSKKNDRESSDDKLLSKNNETVKRSTLLPKTTPPLHNQNIKALNKNIQPSSTTQVSNSNPYNTPILRENHKTSPTHKVLAKQSFATQQVDTTSKVILSKSKNNTKLSLPEGNILVNGTKIASQLQSDPAIAQMAKSITNSTSNDYQKAQDLYVWVARNLHYSTAKENEIVNNSSNINCGALKAFISREGICEDFSTLYAVMANDAGLTTRVVVGKAFGNGHWIAHAWNQVYISSIGWINVDTTFANSYVALINANNIPFNSDGILSTNLYYTYKTAEYNYKIYTEDYFNTQSFNTTHKDAQVLAQLGTV